MASKLCDSCQSATATLYCRTNSAFLCVNCDSKIHVASWLLPNPKAVENPDLNSGQCLFQEMDPYLDLDYGHMDPKLEEAQEQNSCGADGVVLVQSKNMQPLLVNDQSFELDFSADATRFRQPLLGPNLLLPRLCNGATPPATLAEFTLDDSGGLDFYAVRTTVRDPDNHKKISHLTALQELSLQLPPPSRRRRPPEPHHPP
ncbi:hypothetical protein ACFX14_017558 [Malus domestica]